MSTTPQAQPTVDPNLESAQQIADRLAAQAAPATNPAEPQEPGLERDFSVVLETGQTYKAKTKDELIQQLVKAQENASKHIRELKERQQSQPPAAPSQQVQQAPGFDQNHYWQLMASDPLAAQQYALGFTPAAQQLQNQVHEYGQVIEQIKTQAIANQFKAETPDMPIDDESLAKFDKVWEDAKLPLTIMNLKLVHAYCVANKIYSPATQASAPAVAPQAQPNPSFAGPGASSAPVAQMTQQQLMEMPPEKLAEYIRQLQG